MVETIRKDSRTPYEFLTCLSVLFQPGINMTHYASPQSEQLWEKWLDDKSNETADELVRQYTYLVNYHVQRIAAHLPGNISKDDIKSLGLIGLYDAICKFDATRDLKFDTYASFRIKGVILDGLRKEDWLPRSFREKTKKVERAYEELEKQLERKPTPAEISQLTGLREAEVEEAVKNALFSHLLSIEEKSNHPQGEHKEGFAYSLPDTQENTPEQKLVKKESLLELESGIEMLNENEQLVISLFYKEELTLTEIGQVLGLTTSRISQIHRKAIFKLKEYLS